MGRMKSFWMDESYKLALDFQKHLETKGVCADPDFDGAEAVLMYKVPEADTYWDIEWQWVSQRVAQFSLREQLVGDVILTSLGDGPIHQTHKLKGE